MDFGIPIAAALYGAASAVSLPLGAALGLWLRTPRKITSGLMAFGGGALLFAVALELFGHAIGLAEGDSGRVDKPSFLIVTMLAAAAGGVLFNLLNRALENRGAFLRKGALIRKHIAQEQRGKARRLLRSLSRIDFFRRLPAEEVIRLLPDVQAVAFEPNATIFCEGEAGDSLYVITEGEVRIVRGNGEGAEELAVLGPGSVFGEMALVTDHPRMATATAQGGVRLWRLAKTDFKRQLETSPALEVALGRVVSARLDDLATRGPAPNEESRSWARRVLRRFEDHMLPAERKALHHTEHGNSAFAIWLGMVLDGIPESLLIGMLAVAAAATGGTLSLAFIVGVFIANLPEAMSSAVTMRNGGMRACRILGMWFSLCVLAAVGAFIGALVFPAHPSGTHMYFLLAMEGLAAGAMLTMIAETMLPEAFEQGGGPIVGLSTLGGFLAAMAVKLIH